MAKNCVVNLDITPNATGFTIGGGTTARSITIAGATNFTLTTPATSGNYTLPNVATDTLVGYSTWTGKGVLIGATAANTPAALAASGTDGFVLTYDSGTATGLKWASAPLSDLPWSFPAGAAVTLVADNGYVNTNVGLTTFTLPATFAAGTIIEICGQGAGGWLIAQNALQSIILGSSQTTVGIGGSIASTNKNDTIRLLCTVADTTLVALSAVGNLTIV